jgi:hypothetical protein
MKGLIFNILSELSERAGCQDDAWEVALAGAALGDDEYELEYEAESSEDDAERARGGIMTAEEAAAEDAEDDALEAEAFEMPYLEGEWGDSFRNLVRSAGPFADSDWAHLPGTPVSFGRGAERRPSEASGDRSSFLPDPDVTDPYFLLMLSLSGAKR